MLFSLCSPLRVAIYISFPFFLYRFEYLHSILLSVCSFPFHIPFLCFCFVFLFFSFSLTLSFPSIFFHRDGMKRVGESIPWWKFRNCRMYVPTYVPTYSWMHTCIYIDITHTHTHNTTPHICDKTNVIFSIGFNLTKCFSPSLYFFFFFPFSRCSSFSRWLDAFSAWCYSIIQKGKER